MLKDNKYCHNRMHDLIKQGIRIVRRHMDRGGLWLSSRGLGCAPVYSGCGDAG